ncbi:hypothetical protein OAS19_01045 [Altererythrobacter sp.]|nr:hypothetical protein [Altererythrobacter sp.]
MTDFDTVQLIALIGWLVLAAGALASYKLSWKSGLKMALVWGSIFTGVAFFISLVQ